MVTVELYTRHECCLCADARAVLDSVRAEQPFELRVVDIDEAGGDPDLARRFGEEVPVVFVDGRKAFKYRVDAADLRRRLAGARAGARR